MNICISETKKKKKTLKLNNTFETKFNSIRKIRKNNKTKYKPILPYFVVVVVYFSFFHNKITKSCNRFDDFMTVSHSTKHSLVYTFVRLSKPVQAILLLLSQMRGLKIFNTHTSRRAVGGEKCIFEKKLTNFISHKFWASIKIIDNT